MQVVLVMFRADGERKSFSITRDVTVMGRREDCDFRIPLGDISRKHCRLIKDNDVLRVEDLGSSNGTYINGKRIHETELQAGDTVQIGPVVFVLQLDGAPEEDELKPYQPVTKEQQQHAEIPGESADAGHADETDQPETRLDADADGDFDPMSVLEGNVDSDIMPALPDSAIREDIMLDMSDSGQRNP